MSEAIFDGLDAVLTRWTTGGAAAPVASMWREQLGTEPAEAELRLLALSGQFLGMAVTTAAPTDLSVLPDIPTLALPAVPEALRPLVRRNLATMKEARLRSEWLHFLALRGWTLHPGDWMPTADDEDCPDLYAPWQDWADMAASAAAVAELTHDALTAETWDDYGPAARRVALARLRLCDPQAARVLLEARVAGMSADWRLRLLGLLAIGLSSDDVPFLVSLAGTDRAPKVRVLASSLLGRLGHGTDPDEDVAELANFFELQTKGLLRRTKVLAARETKTPAQVVRRRQLFAGTDVTAFAAALQVRIDDLPAIWNWGDDLLADADFATMAERCGSDRLIAALLDSMERKAVCNVQALLALRPRLGPARRKALARQALAAGESFQSALWIAGGCGGIGDAADTPAGTKLLKGLEDAEGVKPAAQATELLALGLIASRAAAIGTMERLRAAGLPSADPRLDMLRLNAMLEDNEVKA